VLDALGKAASRWRMVLIRSLRRAGRDGRRDLLRGDDRRPSMAVAA
jgi:hypothetical protein